MSGSMKHTELLRTAITEQVYGSGYRKEVLAALNSLVEELEALQREQQEWITHPYGVAEMAALHQQLEAAEAVLQELRNAADNSVMSNDLVGAFCRKVLGTHPALTAYGSNPQQPKRLLGRKVVDPAKAPDA